MRCSLLSLSFPYSKTLTGTAALLGLRTVAAEGGTVPWLARELMCLKEFFKMRERL